MYYICRRKEEFANFISKASSGGEKFYCGLYILVAIVESFFELIVKVLNLILKY